VLALVAFGSARALDVKKKLVPLAPDEQLDSREFFRPELSVSLGNELAPLPPALADVAGPFAQLYVDPRSGAVTNLVAAIPMIPGAGTGNAVSLEALALSLGRPVTSVDAAVVGDLVRGFAVRNAGALQLDAAQIGPSYAQPVTPELWHVRMPQVVNGVPVRYAHIAAALNNGNMVLFGSEMWGNVTIDTTPVFGPDEAIERASRTPAAGPRATCSGRKPTSRSSPPHPAATPAPTATFSHGSSASGARARSRGGKSSSTRTTARSSRSRTPISTSPRKVQGGAYPLTNTGICPANTTCGAMQAGEPMPYADTGLAAPNNFTDASGVYDYTSGTATTTLNGRFVRMTDTCGPISFSSATGNIDLEGVNGQHDCTSAGGSAGNTAATRSGYYEINKLIEVAKGWLPSNVWLTRRSPRT
jgi:hypothetical protein